VIDILGGADEAIKRLGRLPANWNVRPFDSITPAEFLADLDAFVHVAHPDMEEAFGRTILEALAVGVPVITEPRFARPFGDAVIACDPLEVRTHLEQLRTDPDFYDQLVQRGHGLVESRFGFSAHHRRVRRLAG
jgi:glycosyltransferase involved in cell wall biosynthesis